MSSSSGSTGGDWTKILYFTPDAQNPGSHIIAVTDDNLQDYFEEIDGTEDQIIEVSIFKQNLFLWFPKWFGAWHEFTVVESKDLYWSFEKDSEGICVQRSKSLNSVKYYYHGKRRTGTVVPEGMSSQEGIDGETIQNIFIWIYRKDYLNQGYHVTQSNCHYFASLLFESIAHQKAISSDEKTGEVAPEIENKSNTHLLYFNPGWFDKKYE